MARKKISYPDFAWMRLDDPNNLMVITGLMTFDTPLDHERLKATLEHSLFRFRRFRQRLIQPNLPFQRPYWEDDPSFNLDSHLTRVQLPSPADQKALQDLISKLLSTRLDYSRPLWKFYLVENYGKGSAFIARLHHSLADGIALMQVLLSLTDTTAKPIASDQPQDSALNGVESQRGSIKTLKSAALNSDRWSTRKLWDEGKMIFFNPSRLRYRTSQIIDLAATTGRLVLRWPDPKTVFKGPLGLEKRAAWSEPIELKDVKFIGKEFHGTVNDVIITAVAGALGQYIDSRGDVAEDLSIRGFIPVNLRPIEVDEELGNKFGLIFLSLPVGIDDPIERLRRVRQNMDELKSSSEPIATYGIINLLGALPSRIEEMAANLLDTKGTTVMTNVPGAQTQLYLAGAPINTVMAWVPQAGRIALGVSILSYNGKVWLGIATDQGLVPDPETIVAFFQAEFEEMCSRAQKNQVERQKQLKPLFSMLDEAMHTLDELLAATDQEE
jgi:WS/DGAT/MGAT family acyltransferase